MAKLQSFEEFSKFKAEQDSIALEKEQNIKREVKASFFKNLLAEYNVDSISSLTPEQKQEFYSRLEESKKTVIEGNAFGDAVRKAKETGKEEFEFEGKAYKVTNVDKEDKENAEDFAEESTANENQVKIGDKVIGLYRTGKNNPEYKGTVSDIQKNGGIVISLDKPLSSTGQASVVLPPKDVIKEESVVTEGKDDFIARHSGTNITLKKGYKHYTEEELNDLYDKLGDLVKTLKVKDVTLVFESEVSEAKGFKNTKDFEAFLKEIDSMPEAQIKKIMGKDYIDTPGFYEDEKDDYEDVIDFMISNMGREDFNELKDWWENNVAESVITEDKLPKKGSTVKLQPDINLVSFIDIKDQELKVIDYKKTGLISGPSKFLIVKDDKGKKHEINPEYIQESVVNEADINSDDEFKEYAFTVLQKAFGDDFDEAKAQEVVDGILGKVDGDYGKAAGILQSSLG
jgi:hypothetical protein